MFVVVMIKGANLVAKARCDRCVTSDNFWSFLSNSISKRKANSKSQSITMVVTHTTTSSPTVGTSQTNPKKNRRKITRKNPAAFPSDPSSSQRHAQDDDITFDAGVQDGVMCLGESGSQLMERAKDADDDELMIDVDPTSLAPETSAAPTFAPVAPGADKTTLKSETRRIPIPPHRMTPLKKDWLHIFGPLTEILGLQVRMNVQRRSVEIRVRFLFPAHSIP